MIVVSFLRRHRRARRLLYTLLALMALYTLLGFLVLPAVLRSVLQDKLGAALNREVTIRQIRLNPYSFALRVRGVVIKERGRPETFASLDEVFVNVQASSITKGGLVVREVLLDGPFVSIRREDEVTYNFSDLLTPAPTSAPVEPPAKPFKFAIGNIQVRRGRIDFWDGPLKTRHEARDLTLSVPFISNLPVYVETYVQPHFAVTVDGRPLRLEGRTKPFSGSRETVVDLDLGGIDLTRYVGYVPMRLRFKLLSGTLDVHAAVTFAQPTGSDPSIAVSGSIALSDLRAVHEGGQPLLNLPRLTTEIAPSNVFTGPITITSTVLDALDLSVRRDRAGNLSVASLIEAPPATQPAPKAAAPGGGARPAAGPREAKKPAPAAAPALVLQVKTFEVRRATLRFADASGVGPFATTLSGVNLKVEGLSTKPGAHATARLRLRTEAGEELALDSLLSIAPVTASGTLSAQHLVLRKYRPFYQQGLLFELESGTLDLEAGYAFAQQGARTDFTIKDAGATLTALKLRRRGDRAPFLSVPALKVAGAGFDLGARSVTVASIATREGRVSLARLPDGKLTVETLVAPPPPLRGAPPAPARAPAADKPWVIMLKSVELDGYAIKAEDHVPPSPVTVALDQIRLRLDDVTTAPGGRARLTLSCRLNGSGTIGVRGTAAFLPTVALDLKLDVKRIGIVPFQIYAADRLRAVLTKGEVSTSGTLRLEVPETGAPRVAYLGDAALDAITAIDKATAEELVAWSSLAIKGVDFSMNPERVNVREVALAGLSSRLVVEPDGSINLTKILQESPKTAPPAKGTAAAVAPKPAPRGGETGGASGGPITIGTVTIKDGRVLFTDTSIKPTYSMKLEEVQARVTDLSSDPGTRAALELTAKLENSASLEITGKANPLSKDLFLDVTVAFHDVELSSFTPYAGTFAGYAVEKGKLTLELKYTVDKRKLDARNNVHIDQLTFGSKVQSPKATKLPVRLAVALLKDRKGVIKLDVPVSGSLDDPKFSVWRIVLKVITNLLVKAAVSPFALLGALFGAGEELSVVEFDPGAATLTERERTKTLTLVKALADRPALRLDVVGHVDPVRDREALKRLRYDRKLGAQKLKEILARGEPPVALDAIRLAPEERERYLTLAYKEEKIPNKPRNFLGMAKSVPPAEMEQLMLAAITIGDDDLRQLAIARSQAVKEAVLRSRQVAAGRVFALEPRSLRPPPRDTVRESRVDLTLK